MSRLITFATFAALLLSCASVHADPCRATTTDGYLGVDATGAPGALGLQARVKTFSNDGFLASMGGKAVSGVPVGFSLLFPGDTAPWYLGTGTTDSDGWAVLDLERFYGRDAGGLYLETPGDGGVRHPLDRSGFIQVLAEVSETVGGCSDGVVLPDVYGSIYFRHPDDTAPILFSDIDDTIFNSADIANIIRIIISGHYPLIDGDVIDATHLYRDAGGVFIGITAQFSSLRPFTRSELLRWEFDTPYIDLPYYYDDTGFDGSYLGRTLTYVANNEYPEGGTGADYSSEHCEFKVEKFYQLIDGVFGGNWQDVVGMIGDSENSDGCAARESGIHWYALMEDGDRVEDTSDPSSYTEISGGWAEALPIVCDDAGLRCEAL